MAKRQCPPHEHFHPEAWRTVWNRLDAPTQQRIREKAVWEQMSLSAVVRDWWPDLWATVRCPHVSTPPPEAR